MCPLCDFTHNNKYQKVRSIGLSVWKHHETIDCKHSSQAEDDDITKEIKQRMQAAKEEKLRKKNLKKPCPFGCGKSWKNILTAFVKKHVLHGCSFREGQEHLLLGFFAKKTLSWAILILRGGALVMPTFKKKCIFRNWNFLCRQRILFKIFS